MIDLSGVVLGLADTTLAVSRPVASWGNDGRPVTTSTSLSALALVVPAKRRRSETERGVVLDGAVDIYSAVELKASDTFTLGGVDYRVDLVDSYYPTGGFRVSRAVVVTS